MPTDWIADRMRHIDASGIRKVFDLAAEMTDPVNLSIGQPHFDTPQPIREALKAAVDDGKNAYSQTQGIKPLLEKIQSQVDARYRHADRRAFITSGTSGALMLALCTLVDPGDEVIVFDPYFVMYKHLTTLAGGRTVVVETYPDFRIDLDRVREAVTDRTKVILFNSPANPTGAVASEDEVRGLAELAAERDIALISDEIYRVFCYDQPLVSPAEFNEQTIVIDGFSKSHSMTGWRVGWCHGPGEIISQMMKLQQFTFVCAPHPAQWAALAACDFDVSGYADEYRAKRNFMCEELSDVFHIQGAQGAFYMFLPAPWGTGSEFVAEAIRNNLLIIPGNVFSDRDTHFRISYAAEDATLQRGVEILKRLAERGD
ncbi:MAG: aminotransferase class I/II-fold pyridoxal phosphate-dependent enzyme [Planctomycetota bacterium]|nr:MAG: aminotransferase class I/II-fold pyridoxal phosphate-dependent enzyme [Planctomycetota bacterium]REJ91542.1 MAG: aminotransferase class I/II-fold pyridoxal phosphate-dependent enzyme [Planctomycetota bacterium]REK20525.1 MAG: aminotransferase class I/II-fold pyridoxal phosphate-dependent enzyme [Planctomycetota bacterium]REK28279.1 MAG: aminotransferase class I/II-fold pyridoxal phosphate-dependent enzyme [Planctomycetota bacterium]